MPGNVELSITVPSGTCYENPGVDWPLLVSLITANLIGNLSTVNSGATTPAAADRDKPWNRSNSDGTDDGQWTFYNGFWVQKHPDFVGKICFAPVGTASTDIDTLDGGEVGAITNITGPFWSIVTELAAKSIIGPGTLPSGTIINVGDSIGEEKHQLSIAELPAHTHQFDTTDGAQVLIKVSSNKVGDINQTGSLNYGFANAPQNTGGDTAHNTIHPAYALFAIQRTARLYRRRNA
jgi:hypothetical protein